MPLYITDRLSSFEIKHNPFSNFIYFDTIKKDNNDGVTLVLREKDNGLPITYAESMSSDSIWDKKAFNRNKEIFQEEFKNIEIKLMENKLVVLPVQTYNIIFSNLNFAVKPIFSDKIDSLIERATRKKDFVNYAFSFKL